MPFFEYDISLYDKDEGYTDKEEEVEDERNNENNKEDERNIQKFLNSKLQNIKINVYRLKNNNIDQLSNMAREGI